jgi:hypothetical protein
MFLRNKWRKHKTELPQSTEGDANDVETNRNESTPLVQGSDMTAFSSLGEERLVGDTAPVTLEPLAEDNKVDTVGRLAWAKVRDRVAKGDFLLQGAFTGGKQGEGAANVGGNHEVMVQEAIEEFRSGMEFSVVHCFVAIFIYFAVSIVCYNIFLEPEWSVVDSCYFAVTTFTTVGYGGKNESLKRSFFWSFQSSSQILSFCFGFAFPIKKISRPQRKHP